MKNAKKIFYITWNNLEEKEKKYFIFLIFIIFLSLFIEMFGLSVVVALISTFLDESSFNFYIASHFYFLKIIEDKFQIGVISILLITLVLLYLIKSLYLTYVFFLQAKFTQLIRMRLGTRLFSKYLKKPYVFYLRRKTSELTNNIVTEVDFYPSLILQPFFVILTEILFTSGVLIVLVFFQPTNAITFFLFLTFLIYLILKFTKKKLSKNSYIREKIDQDKFNLLRNAFLSIKDIKVSGLENIFEQNFQKISNIRRKILYLIEFLNSIPRIWIEFIAVMFLISFVFFFKINQYSNVEIIKILGIMTISIFKILPSVNKIILAFQSIKNGTASIDKLYLELKESSEEDTKNHSKLNLEKIKTIRVRNLSFKYFDKKLDVLENISIEIGEGDFVNISGESGCGKSTLCDILVGILEKNEGDIIINGKKTLKGLREYKQVGYISQNTYLLNDTILSNIIIYGKEEINYEKLNSVLETVCLKNFIDSLPLKLNTELTERSGANISGGQRQKIALARALYYSPSILIMDESTSAIDMETERKIFKNIKKTFKNNIVINISHREPHEDISNVIYDFKWCKESKKFILLKR